jgi:hypothetical protein
LQNPNVSLCDPYCIGLLKEHLVKLKSFFYPISNSKDYDKLSNHPSILNRFSLESETNEIGNFALEMNNKQVNNKSFDSLYIDNFREQKTYKHPISVMPL